MTEKYEIERKAAAMVMAAAELNAQEVGTGRQFFTHRFMRAVAELEAVSQARLYDILTAGLVKDKDSAEDAMIALNDQKIAALDAIDELEVRNTSLRNALENERRKRRKAERAAKKKGERL